MVRKIEQSQKRGEDRRINSKKSYARVYYFRTFAGRHDVCRGISGGYNEYASPRVRTRCRVGNPHTSRGPPGTRDLSSANPPPGFFSTERAAALPCQTSADPAAAARRNLSPASLPLPRFSTGLSPGRTGFPWIPPRGKRKNAVRARTDREKEGREKESKRTSRAITLPLSSPQAPALVKARERSRPRPRSLIRRLISVTRGHPPTITST